MSTGLVLMSKLMAMMVMVAVGYAAVKLHVVESSDSRTLSRLTVYILQPCLICRSVQIDLTPERLNGFLCALILGIVTYVFWIAALGLLKKPLRLDAVDRCTLIYSNVGNLALPLNQWRTAPAFPEDHLQSQYHRPGDGHTPGPPSHPTSGCDRHGHGGSGQHGRPQLHAGHRYRDRRERPA